MGVEDFVPKPHAQDAGTQAESENEPIQCMETTPIETMTVVATPMPKKGGKYKKKKNGGSSFIRPKAIVKVDATNYRQQQKK